MLFRSLTLLGGCNFVVLHPAGYVAEQQRNLVLAATGLMLLIIVPVIAFTLIFAWRYRATNEDAVYDPEWHHSTQLEVLIWTAPLMIIIALGIALFIMALSARTQTLTVQNRVIRLEMRHRLRELLPADVAARALALPMSQLVSLRFASD